MGATFELANAFERAEANPNSFGLPDQQRIRTLTPGSLVKLVFLITHGSPDEGRVTEGERMWVEITDCDYPRFSGVLDNDPYCTPDIQAGLKVEFTEKNIIDVYEG